MSGLQIILHAILRRPPVRFLLDRVRERSERWHPGAPGMPYAQGILGYVPLMPPNAPPPPYTIVPVTDAAASATTGIPDAAWTVVLAEQPVSLECAESSPESDRQPCAVFRIARDGRVLSGHWHSVESFAFAFAAGSIRAEISVADGWLRGTLRNADDPQFPPSLVDVRLEAPCPTCE